MYLDTSSVQSLEEKLLLCTANEFVEYGYEGTRADNIVKAAGYSRQTVYHRSSDKEDLFIGVLEYTRNDTRQKEKALNSSDLLPQRAIERIIDFTWDYYIPDPWFLRIVHSGNQSRGAHYVKSQCFLEINRTYLQLVESLLDERKEQNILKPDIGLLQVNINIAVFGGCYLINQHTLGPAYHISMISSRTLKARHKVIKKTTLS